MFKRKWYNHLAEMRREKGYSNKEFVSAVKQTDKRFDIGILSKIENSYVLPRKEMVAVFAEILGCDTADLFPKMRF